MNSSNNLWGDDEINQRNDTTRDVDQSSDDEDYSGNLPTAEDEPENEDDSLVIACIADYNTFKSVLKAINPGKSSESSLVIIYTKDNIVLAHSKPSCGQSKNEDVLTCVAYIHQENLLKYTYSHTEDSLRFAYNPGTYFTATKCMGKDDCIEMSVNKDGRARFFNPITFESAYVNSLTSESFTLKYSKYDKSMIDDSCRLTAISAVNGISNSASISTIRSAFYLYGYKNGFNIDSYGLDGSMIKTACIGEVDDGHYGKDSIVEAFSCLPSKKEKRSGIIWKYCTSKNILKQLLGIFKLAPKHSIIKVLFEEWKPIFFTSKLGGMGTILTFVSHQPDIC